MEAIASVAVVPSIAWDRDTMPTTAQYREAVMRLHGWGAHIEGAGRGVRSMMTDRQKGTARSPSDSTSTFDAHADVERCLKTKARLLPSLLGYMYTPDGVDNRKREFGYVMVCYGPDLRHGERRAVEKVLKRIRRLFIVSMVRDLGLCPTCGGTSRNPNYGLEAWASRDCGTCNGTGEVRFVEVK